MASPKIKSAHHPPSSAEQVEVIRLPLKQKTWPKISTKETVIRNRTKHYKNGHQKLKFEDFPPELLSNHQPSQPPVQDSPSPIVSTFSPNFLQWSLLQVFPSTDWTVIELRYCQIFCTKKKTRIHITWWSEMSEYSILLCHNALQWWNKTEANTKDSEWAWMLRWEKLTKCFQEYYFVPWDVFMLAVVRGGLCCAKRILNNDTRQI